MSSGLDSFFVHVSPNAYSIVMSNQTRLTAAEFEQKQARLARLSHVLDDAIRIPGTHFRIGADALIGLIPGVGDAAGALIGGYMIWEAHQLGAPSNVKWKMAGNVGLDALVGVIPLIGDLSDFVFRANRKNMALLQAHLESQRPAPLPVEDTTSRRRMWWLLGGVAALSLAVFLLLA